MRPPTPSRMAGYPSRDRVAVSGTALLTAPVPSRGSPPQERRSLRRAIGALSLVLVANGLWVYLAALPSAGVPGGVRSAVFLGVMVASPLVMALLIVRLRWRSLAQRRDFAVRLLTIFASAYALLVVFSAGQTGSAGAAGLSAAAEGQIFAAAMVGCSLDVTVALLPSAEDGRRLLLGLAAVGAPSACAYGLASTVPGIEATPGGFLLTVVAAAILFLIGSYLLDPRAFPSLLPRSSPLSWERLLPRPDGAPGRWATWAPPAARRPALRASTFGAGGPIDRRSGAPPIAAAPASSNPPTEQRFREWEERLRRRESELEERARKLSAIEADLVHREAVSAVPPSSLLARSGAVSAPRANVPRPVGSPRPTDGPPTLDRDVPRSEPSRPVSGPSPSPSVLRTPPPPSPMSARTADAYSRGPAPAPAPGLRPLVPLPASLPGPEVTGSPGRSDLPRSPLTVREDRTTPAAIGPRTTAGLGTSAAVCLIADGPGLSSPVLTEFLREGFEQGDAVIVVALEPPRDGRRPPFPPAAAWVEQCVRERRWFSVNGFREAVVPERGGSEVADAENEPPRHGRTLSQFLATLREVDARETTRCRVVVLGASAPLERADYRVVLALLRNLVGLVRGRGGRILVELPQGIPSRLPPEELARYVDRTLWLRAGGVWSEIPAARAAGEDPSGADDRRAR